MDEPEVLRLVTIGRRSGQARATELWFTRLAGRDYVIAETGEHAQWVRNLRAEPRVRWRVGREDRAGRARPVPAPDDPALVRAVRARFDAKYGWSDGLVVELAPEAPAPPRSR